MRGDTEKGWQESREQRTLEVTGDQPGTAEYTYQVHNYREGKTEFHDILSPHVKGPNLGLCKHAKYSHPNARPIKIEAAIEMKISNSGQWSHFARKERKILFHRLIIHDAQVSDISFYISIP